jgi:hypothetical protein
MKSNIFIPHRGFYILFPINDKEPSILSATNILLILFCIGIFTKDNFGQVADGSGSGRDTAITCQYNSDNIIYQPFREFAYLLRTTVDPDDFSYSDKLCLSEHLRGEIILKLKIFPGCFYDQTMIKYEYLVNDSVFNEETTGLIEDNKTVWIHPPRSLMEVVEISPFFEFKYSRKKWRSAILLFRNPNPEITDRKTIWARHKARVEKDTIFRFNNEDLICRKIYIETLNRGRRFYSTMLFNEKLGFVRMDVQFINGKHYSLELIGTKQDFRKGNF